MIIDIQYDYLKNYYEHVNENRTLIFFFRCNMLI